LDLWASNKKLIELQNSDPEINLSKELFQQWKDSYKIDTNILRKAFSSTELDLLAKFDKTVHDNFENFNNSKQIDFWKTNEWEELNTDATKILKKLNEK
jgi:hypothetical protein